MIYQTEKQLSEFGDKIPAAQKAQLEDLVKKLREAHKREDLTEIDKLMAEIQQVWSAASQTMYQQTGGADAQAGEQQPGPGATGQDTNQNNSFHKVMLLMLITRK